MTAVSCAALLLNAASALAAHDSSHAGDQIREVTEQAEADIADVVDSFDHEIAGLSDADAVASSADQAMDAVDSIWTSARNAIDDLIQLYPGVGSVGGAAKQQLSQTRLTARATISDLENAWESSLPVTTTLPPTPTITSPTITIPTTTSTTTTTTTTTPGSDNGNRGAAASGAGSDNGNGSNGNGSSGSASSGSAGANQDPNTPSPSPSPSSDVTTGPSTDEIGGTGFELAAQTPDQPFTVQSATITSLLESEDMGATVKMAAMLETVLPPAVVDLVLSPLLILEILLRTIVDGGLTFLGPLALLGVSALAIFIYDRWSRGAVSLDRV